MKKMVILVFVLFLFLGCASVKELEEEKKMGDAKAVILDGFVGSELEGNFVWGVAMNFCWNELGNSILNENPLLATKNDDALRIVKAFNEFNLNKEILDEPSYFVKAGYGQKTVEFINKQVKKKFPKKSFSDLELELENEDIISYAYFLKDLKFIYEFEEKTFKFKGTSVKGFYTEDEEILDTIKIIEYKDDNQFIIRLSLKNKGDEIFLAKGYDMGSPQSILKIINEKNGNFLEAIDSSDKFCVPNIHLDYHRDYSELIGLFLKNKTFENYTIAQMFENIKFDMNKKGAKVENEAVISLKLMALPPDIQKKSRHFILNKPYWIIMKRVDSHQPYFLLGINNTNLMTRTEDKF